MNGLMSRVCSQCGEKLPEGAAFCPRDGTRVVNTNPFGELEATVRHTPSAAQRLARQPAASPSSQPSSARSGPFPPTPRTGPISEDPEQAWEATVARDVLVGKQLDGYVVKRRIGDGGMGIVYEGEHPIIGRKVAIKILRPELTAGVQARDLIAEARAASAIRHRGIIDVFGFGTLPGIGQYLVMEFLEGTPLNKLIAQRAPMAEQEVIALLDELLSALSAAHAAGVIHRDLKPGNVFVERDSSGTECLKVLDFGLAKRSEVPNGSTPQTRASMIVGTPEYIAPEQAIGQAVGPHTDLYAAGLIAFEMLTRRLPFEGGSAVAWVIQHVQKEPPPPSAFVEVHPALDALVLRLLAKEPSQRPASAEEARRELKQILQQISRGERAASSSAAASRAVSRPSASGGEERTVARATPMTGPRPSLPPASSPLLRSSEAAAGVDEPATLPAREKAAAPNRRGLVGAVVAVAIIVLAGLGGWMMRTKASPGEPPPVVASVPAGDARAASDSAPPAPSVPALAPEPAPAPVPVEAAPDEGQEPPQAEAPPPEPQPAGSGEDRPAAQKKLGAKTGTLRLIVRGTGTVFVGRRRMGEVPPLNLLTLSEGTHRLSILNPNARPYSAKVKIIAGQTVEHRVTLKPLTGTVHKP